MCNHSQSKALFVFFIYFMCLGVLLAFMSVHYTHAWCLQRPEVGISIPGTELIDSC